MQPNRSLNADPQRKEAASPLVLRSGNLQPGAGLLSAQAEIPRWNGNRIPPKAQSVALGRGFGRVILNPVSRRLFADILLVMPRKTLLNLAQVAVHTVHAYLADQAAVPVKLIAFDAGRSVKCTFAQCLL